MKIYQKVWPVHHDHTMVRHIKNVTLYFITLSSSRSEPFFYKIWYGGISSKYTCNHVSPKFLYQPVNELWLCEGSQESVITLVCSTQTHTLTICMHSINTSQWNTSKLVMCRKPKFGSDSFLSRISTLMSDIDIAHLSTCLSVRDVAVLCKNGLTYCRTSFATR